MVDGVRPERTFETYSRGAELVRAIYRMWERNEQLPRDCWDRTLWTNRIIERRIEAIRQEFDLTVTEWHYWCRQARGGMTQ